jgi:hypothetical protein
VRVPVVVEEVTRLLDDALELFPERGVLLHHPSHHVFQLLKGAGDCVHPVGRSWHGGGPYTEVRVCKK